MNDNGDNIMAGDPDYDWDDYAGPDKPLLIRIRDWFTRTYWLWTSSSFVRELKARWKSFWHPPISAVFTQTQEIGLKLEARRKELGYTYAQVARRASLRTWYVKQVLQGEGSLQLSRLMDLNYLAGALEMKVDISVNMMPKGR